MIKPFGYNLPSSIYYLSPDSDVSLTHITHSYSPLSVTEGDSIPSIHDLPFQMGSSSIWEAEPLAINRLWTHQPVYRHPVDVPDASARHLEQELRSTLRRWKAFQETPLWELKSDQLDRAIARIRDLTSLFGEITQYEDRQRFAGLIEEVEVVLKQSYHKIAEHFEVLKAVYEKWTLEHLAAAGRKLRNQLRMISAALLEMSNYTEAWEQQQQLIDLVEEVRGLIENVNLEMERKAIVDAERYGYREVSNERERYWSMLGVSRRTAERTALPHPVAEFMMNELDRLFPEFFKKDKLRLKHLRAGFRHRVGQVLDLEPEMWERIGQFYERMEKDFHRFNFLRLFTKSSRPCFDL